MDRVAIWKLNRLNSGRPLLEPVRLDPQPASLNAASRWLPEGVYTTFRTFEGLKMLPLEDHVRRLEESACLVNSETPLDEAAIHAGLHAAVQRYPAGEKRLRITVDLTVVHGDVYISLEPLHVPSPEDYESGVRAITCASHRENPKAKQTRFISVAEAVRRDLPPDVNEGLLLDASGCILEGLSSNFFAVKESVLYTAEEGVLAGITRTMVLKLIRRLEIPVRLEAVSTAAIPDLQEAFITSASRLILPVTRIDGAQIGSGMPGPVTRRLIGAFNEEIQADLIEI